MSLKEYNAEIFNVMFVPHFSTRL